MVEILFGKQRDPVWETTYRQYVQVPQERGRASTPVERAKKPADKGTTDRRQSAKSSSLPSSSKKTSTKDTGRTSSPPSSRSRGARTDVRTDARQPTRKSGHADLPRSSDRNRRRQSASPPRREHRSDEGAERSNKAEVLEDLPFPPGYIPKGLATESAKQKGGESDSRNRALRNQEESGLQTSVPSDNQARAADQARNSAQLTSIDQVITVDHTHTSSKCLTLGIIF